MKPYLLKDAVVEVEIFENYSCVKFSLDFKCLAPCHSSFIALLVQGTGIKKWYAAGVGWVDFGQNSGTLQPNHTHTENMLRW